MVMSFIVVVVLVTIEGGNFFTSVRLPDTNERSVTIVDKRD